MVDYRPPPCISSLAVWKTGRVSSWYIISREWHRDRRIDCIALLMWDYVQSSPFSMHYKQHRAKGDGLLSLLLSVLMWKEMALTCLWESDRRPRVSGIESACTVYCAPEGEFQSVEKNIQCSNFPYRCLAEQVVQMNSIYMTGYDLLWLAMIVLPFPLRVWCHAGYSCVAVWLLHTLFCKVYTNSCNLLSVVSTPTHKQKELALDQVLCINYVHYRIYYASVCMCSEGI